MNKLKFTALAIMVGACSESPSLPVISDPSSIAVVYGTVRNTQGAPVVGLSVTGRVYNARLNPVQNGQACSGTPMNTNFAFTDLAGHYRVELSVFIDNPPICVDVTLRRSGAFVADTSGIALQTRFPPETPDSIKIDFVAPQ